MSDNGAKIIVPVENVQPGSFSPLYQGVVAWLDSNVSRYRFGTYARYASDDIAGVQQICFIFYHVPNATRLAFAEKFGGTVTFEKTALFRKEGNRHYVICIPEKNVVKESSHNLDTAVHEWLTENIDNNAGDWNWCAGDLINDVQYCSFVLRNVDDDMAALFKLTFG